MKLGINQERWIFEDYENESKVISRVKLLKYVREGLSFILKDMPKNKQVVYGISYWKCQILSTGSYYPVDSIKTFPIRYIKQIGDPNIEEIIENEEVVYEDYTRIDKFIEIDGEQAF